MNLWIYWPAALAFLLFVLFAVPEAYALYEGDISKHPTFSRFMVTMNRATAFWPFAWGCVVGGLVVHLMLPWCP